MLVVLSPTKLTDFYGLLPFSQSGNFNTITILRNSGFSALFRKYVLFVWNKLCPPIRWIIFQGVWRLLILLTILKLISRSSHFARITILWNGVFSPLFNKYVLIVLSNKMTNISKSLGTSHFIDRTRTNFAK